MVTCFHVIRVVRILRQKIETSVRVLANSACHFSEFCTVYVHFCKPVLTMFALNLKFKIQKDL